MGQFLGEVAELTRKVGAWPRHRKLLAARSAAVLLGVKAGLTLCPTRTIRIFTARARSSSCGRGADAQSSREIVFVLDAVSRRVPGGGNCLVRALAARWMLSVYGYRTDLKFGVARSDSSTLDAHAWLEVDGEVAIGGGPGSRIELASAALDRRT